MTSDEAELDKYSIINFEETELRLGLPGGSSSSSNDVESSSSGLRISSICGNNSNNKRGFSETNGCGGVDLKLNLCSSSNNNGDLSSVSASCVTKENNNSSSSSNVLPLPRDNDPAKPPAKAQVVGWPPVRSFRKNIVNNNNNNNNNIQRSNSKKEPEKNTTTAITTATSGGATVTSASASVKVSVDGAPYLRKVDLKQYKSYKELSDVLAKMFSSSSFTVNCGSQSNETKLTTGSDYVPTYEDKDGDWMLVGDVPWEMFVESCKRLRMRKDSEAIGVAPRAVEKCKNKS